MNERDEEGRASAQSEEGEGLLEGIAEHTETLNVQAMRAEIDVKIGAAHKYPRDLARFLRTAKAMACMTKEIAESCSYSLKRKDKDGSPIIISGPSIRLAEICAAAYGNFRSGAKIIDAYADGGKRVIVEGYAEDLETNNSTTEPGSRNTTTKKGQPYGEDMRGITLRAASRIAKREAVFGIIPKSYVEEIRREAIKVATGGKPLDIARKETVERIALRIKEAGIEGFGEKDVPRLVGKKDVLALDMDDVAALIGFGTAVRDGEEDWAGIIAQSTGNGPIRMPQAREEATAPAAPSAPATETKPESAAPAEEAKESNPAADAINKAAQADAIKAGAKTLNMGNAELNGFLAQFLGQDGEGRDFVDIDKALAETATFAKVSGKAVKKS